MKKNQTEASRRAQPPVALTPILVDEGGTTELASLIRPLPRSVLPSPGFLAQLRGRILALPDQSQSARGRAA